MTTNSDDALIDARRETIEAFAQAWSEKNIDAALDCMTEDCVYGASVGPEPGQTYRGRKQVREGILAMMKHDRTIRSELRNLLFSGDRAVWEWFYYSHNEAGVEMIDHGCDLIWFEGDRIAVKQAFRKVRAC